MQSVDHGLVAVVVGGWFAGGGGQVQQERITVQGRPTGVQEPGQCFGGGAVVEVGCVDCGDGVVGSAVDDRDQQRLPGWVVRIDGLSGHPGRRGDIGDGRVGAFTEERARRVEDRREAPFGIGATATTPRDPRELCPTCQG